MTAIQYVKENLQRDYGEKAEQIVPHLDAHMDEMRKSVGLAEGELNSRFQDLLDDMLYPFLACMRAMEGCGIPETEADGHCRGLWDDMPIETKRRVTMEMDR